MCRSTQDHGGPRRCSADARTTLQGSHAAIAELETRQAAAAAELAAKSAPPLTQTGPPKAVPRCFFCDELTTEAAHMTRYGKICCHQCWPDVRLTQGPAPSDPHGPPRRV